MPSSAKAAPARPARRTQGERRSDAERALLDAATRSFARKGLDATSLADIGAEAGFSRALVNHHFGSRAALVERLAARSQRRFLENLDLGGHDLESLVGIAAAYLDAVRRHREEMRAFLVMWGSSFAREAQLRPVFAEDDERFRRGVVAVVRAGQEAGTIRSSANPAAFAVVFVAMLRGIAAQHAISPGSVDLEASQATCADLIRAHLDPGPEESR